MVNNETRPAGKGPALGQGGKPRILTFAGQLEFGETVIQALRDCKGDVAAWREFCRDAFGYTGNPAEHDLHTAILQIAHVSYNAGRKDQLAEIREEERQRRAVKVQIQPHAEQFSAEGC